MADIDSLSIQISANAEPAAKSIGDLASAVRRFNSAVAAGGGFKSLNDLANAAKSVTSNVANASNDVNRLAQAMTALNRSKGFEKAAEGIAKSAGSAKAKRKNSGMSFQSCPK